MLDSFSAGGKGRGLRKLVAEAAAIRNAARVSERRLPEFKSKMGVALEFFRDE